MMMTSEEQSDYNINDDDMELVDLRRRFSRSLISVVVVVVEGSDTRRQTTTKLTNHRPAW